MDDTRCSLRDELEEALLSIRAEVPKPIVSLESLREEIARIRSHSHENAIVPLNADLVEV